MKKPVSGFTESCMSRRHSFPEHSDNPCPADIRSRSIPAGRVPQTFIPGAFRQAGSRRHSFPERSDKPCPADIRSRSVPTSRVTEVDGSTARIISAYQTSGLNADPNMEKIFGPMQEKSTLFSEAINRLKAKSGVMDVCPKPAQ